MLWLSNCSYVGTWTQTIHKYGYSYIKPPEYQKDCGVYAASGQIWLSLSTHWFLSTKVDVDDWTEVVHSEKWWQIRKAQSLRGENIGPASVPFCASRLSLSHTASF